MTVQVRGKRVSQWVGQKGIAKLIRHSFPGTPYTVQSCGWRRYRIWWASEAVSYAKMRALADEIEAAVPAKAALKIECQGG